MTNVLNLPSDPTAQDLEDPVFDAVRSVIPQFDMRAHLQRQREWSEKTFGPGDRAKGVIDHIRKELVEIEAEPTSTEWVDVVILALDGFWRAGYSPEQIIEALLAKQTKNEARQWPDWRTAPTDKAIEHVRIETKVDTWSGEGWNQPDVRNAGADV